MRRCIPPLAIAAAAFVAFSPAILNNFVSWDDPVYILNNPWIRGLSIEHARWALTSILNGFWQPLTWLSLQLDYSLWGLEPSGFHLTSLLLHAATSVLFYFVSLTLLEGRKKAAALAALFFAVHPMRAESIAWATERKGLLSGLLFMAAALAYLRGRTRAAFAAFAFSLTAKPTGLTLPCVLMIIETWRARRIPTRRVFLSLAPFFALSAASSGLTYFIGRSAGIITDISSLGPAWRAGRVLYGLLFYPLATLWPSGLSPYYPPLPWFGRLGWQLASCALLTAASLAAAYRARRAYPAVAAVAAAYIAMILPMIGLVQQGLLYAACDRFSYLPCLGFALLFGATLARSRLGTVFAAVWLLALGFASWRQCAIWQDSVTLWSTADVRAPGAVAHGELAGALIQTGNTREGIGLLQETIKDSAAPSTTYVNLGATLQKQGHEDLARQAWRLGLARAPSAELSALLGASLTPDDITTGTKLLTSAVFVEPDHASWRVDLGDALARAARNIEARRQYDIALELDPQLGRAHNNLGLLLEREGRTEDAVAHYRAALGDQASRAQANHNWGNVFLAQGRLSDAERRYREALRLDPSLAHARINLGNVLARQGHFAEAAKLYRAALKADPRSVEARANLGAVAPLLRK